MSAKHPSAGSTVGYSGKPLFEKLGLKPGVTCMPVLAPDHYPALVAGAIDVTYVTARSRSADVVHLFCRNRTVLDARINGALAKVRDGGMLWISWPKKSSPLFVDLTEDQLRDVVLPLQWVDVKVCAVDADWSGLKFFRRKGAPAT